MSNVDISNLPSPEELQKTADISHLPSPDQLSASSTPQDNTPEMSATDAIGNQLLNPFGAGARLAGVGAALTDIPFDVQDKLRDLVHGTKTTLPSPSESYAKGLEKQRDVLAKAQKDQPIASAVGAGLASLPGTIATGGVLGEVGSAVGTGAATGALSSNADYSQVYSGLSKLKNGETPTDAEMNAMKIAGMDIGIGSAIGLGGLGVAKVLGKTLINPTARALGRAGKTIFGKAAEEGINADTETLANDIVTGIRSTKKGVNEAYDRIMEANKDKQIDLTDFTNKLKERAEGFDPTHPDQVRDKKAVMDLISRITEGPEVEKDVVTGFKPGKVTNKDTFQGYEPTKSVPSARETLEAEAKRTIEGNRQLGKTTTASYAPSEDESLLSRILKTDEPEGPVSSVKIVDNTPAYTEVEPKIDTQPFSQEINPITETQTIREGGTLTPDAIAARKLRTNLGSLANETNLSNEGQRFADSTYHDLSDTLKTQIKDLGPTDDKYRAILAAARKFGIKGNDEDVIRVLSKIKSSNQGKEILVDQALDKVGQVNPELSKDILSRANQIDQRQGLMNQVNSIGDFDITKPIKSTISALKNIGGTRAAIGNAFGGLENKVSGNAFAEGALTVAKQLPKTAVNNPFTVSSATSSPTHLQSAYGLLNAPDDHLQLISKQFSKDPKTANISRALEQYLRTGNNNDKNSAIFLYEQNKHAMDMLKPKDE